MQFDEVIRNRHSTRAYIQKPVEDEKLNAILVAANSAPSAGNVQAYEIYVVKSAEKKEALKNAAMDQEFICQAPVCLVFCANPEKSAGEYGKRGRDLYSIQDATIAASFAVLKAVDAGLDVCWVGAFDDKEVKKVVGTEINRPVSIITIGYGAEDHVRTERRDPKEMVHLI